MYAPVDVDPIDDEHTYRRLLAECEALCMQDPELGTEQATRLMVLAIALERYERIHWPCKWSS